MVHVGDIVDTATAPIDADSLGGRPAEDYATESFVTNKIAEAQVGGSGDIDLSGYATKDDLNTKAPAGYGLGTVSTASNSTYVDNANNATLTGWYKIDSNTANGISASAILRVEAYASTYIMQTAIRANGGVISTRYCNNGTWGEWKSMVDTIGAQSTITGAVSTLVSDNLNANIVPISNASGKIVSSNITATELGYLDGVTSNIQSQLYGKAPSGYGLGSGCKMIDWGEIDNITNNGWYGFHNYLSMGGIEFSYGYVRVDALDCNNCKQTLYPIVGGQWQLNAMLIRERVSGEWREWDWVNPPMVTGVEYRTTERFNTWPVYTKFVKLGITASGFSTVGWTTNTADSPIRITARLYAQTLPIFSETGLTALDVHAVGRDVEIYCASKWALNSGEPIWAQIWYCKN